MGALIAGLEAIQVLSRLKSIGDKVVASEVKPEDLMSIAREYNIQLTEEVAQAAAAKIPSFIDSAEETMTAFVSNGGLFRMLFSLVSNGGDPGPSVGRCKHCDNLVFF